MRVVIPILALLLPSMAFLSVPVEAAFLVTKDERYLENVCEIFANEEEDGDFLRPPSPPASWSASLTVCDIGLGTMDSTISDHLLAATITAEAGLTSSHLETALVIFRLEFEVTELVLTEWVDASGTRLETLVPGVTYTIHREILAVNPSQGRLESTASVRIVPEPGTAALLSIGLIALLPRAHCLQKGGANRLTKRVRSPSKRG